MKLQVILQTTTDWIGTLSFCISLSAAPVSVSFIRCLGYRGYRIGGLAGTFILSVSTLASSFVNNLEWLFLTHSILYGLGSSLIYMASSLVIGEHFGKEHKYHVFATSLLLCGYPIGKPWFCFCVWLPWYPCLWGGVWLKCNQPLQEVWFSILSMLGSSPVSPGKLLFERPADWFSSVE